MKSRLILLLLIWVASPTEQATAQIASTSANGPYVFMADPFVLQSEGTYYLYGTGKGNRGIQVFKSSDLNNWQGPVGATDGFALVKGDCYGENHLMGAYVVQNGVDYYLYYVATGRPTIAVAVSKSPLGPFKQDEKKPMNIPGKSIAPHVFKDEDGKSYMYYTKLDKGNMIYVAEMEKDLQAIKENTINECLRVTEPWEKTDRNPPKSGPVAEGAAVLKHKNTYYLFYTANHYLNQDYNVGYATAPTPTGPWTKFAGNPLLKNTAEAVGMGSGEFIKNAAGELLFFYHTHNSLESVHPRKVLYSKVNFVASKNGGPDVVEISPEKHFSLVVSK